MSKKYILGIDTASKKCSVALTQDETLIKYKSEIGKAAHNQKLSTFISTIMDKANLKFEQLSAIAINIGPGSFTGLRIGLSTAKGIAFPHNLPLLPIPTFTILHAMCMGDDGTNLLFIRSHRNHIYFSIRSQSEPTELSPDVDYATVEEVLQSHPDIKNYYGDYKFKKFDQNGTFQTVMPDARYACQIGYKNYDQLIKQDSPELEPQYLTNFEAKKWKPGTQEKK
ncbi:MAG: tRNA (adenosine(37)-N6)-threonylcarbamoyltransferase complex dimerization subunit type 1 TsaB [Candidatus Marinimicrobia bacterium]|nr:tRNA (adenosine(37)-N6)-threonylcarbamoyltransferase complex dimerization subunit type 1 TsaB [Candidatus Neomarinimicrobiota bacterium]